MKFIFTFLFFVFFSIICTSQVLTKVIANGEDKSVIAFATIVYKSNLAFGTYSDEKGRFSIPRIDDDSIIVSYVGFHTRIFSIKEISNIDTIFLFSEAKELTGVVVIPKNLKKRSTRKLGFYHLRKSNIVQAGIKGQKVLVGISNQTDGKVHQIISLNFFLANTTSDNEKTKKGTVRICLYDMNSTCCGPGNNLLPKDIVLTVDKIKHKLEVDVKELMIFLPPCGVFLGLEWLGEKGRSNTHNIQPGYERVTVNEGNHLIYFESYGRKVTTSAKLSYKQSIPMFGIEID